MTVTGQLIAQVKDFTKHPYAWPGGYPLFAITDDGGCLCHTCTKNNLGLIVKAIAQGLRNGWMVTNITVNWEDTELYCDNCNQRIESAYGEN